MSGKRLRWLRRVSIALVALIFVAVGATLVVFRGSPVLAYRSPTGSMQPLLFGAQPPGVPDRFYAELLTYRRRAPRRFEVVTFRYPLDTRQTFVSRVCGLPGEELRVAGGDLWTRPDADSKWTIVRKPANVQRQMWREVAGGGNTWVELDGEAQVEVLDGRIVVSGAGRLRFPTKGVVTASYTDGYPAEARERIRSRLGRSLVGDLRLEGEVRPAIDCTAIRIQLHEADRTYTFELPGPAAATEARPRLIFDRPATGSDAEPTHSEVSAPQPWRPALETPVRFTVQNLDDRLRFELPGLEPLELEIESVANPEAFFELRLEGGGAELRDLSVSRDAHYETKRARMSSWAIPEGQYVMLSDNSLDASDSREWRAARFRWPGVEGVLRGNHRRMDPEEPNPRITMDGSKSRIEFRDAAGELYEAARSEVEELDPEPAPFVPRDLITGRVFLVEHEQSMDPRSQSEWIASVAPAQ